MNVCEKCTQHYGEILVVMTVFKTLDIRGLSFFNSYEQTLKAIQDVKINGVLELILDPKENFTQAFKRWAHSEGYRATDVNGDNRIIRLFIRKLNLREKK